MTDSFIWHEPVDPPEWRSKFGYSQLIIERRARAWLRVQCPSLSERALEQQVSLSIQAMHQDAPTYAETSRRLSEQWAGQAQAKFDAGESERPVDFNKIELEYLAEHFEGANHPVAIAIQAKARQNL